MTTGITRALWALVALQVAAALWAQAPAGNAAGTVSPTADDPVFFQFEDGASAAEGGQVSRSRGVHAMAEGVFSVAKAFFERYRESVGTREPDFADASAYLAEAHVGMAQLAEAEAVLLDHERRSPGLRDREQQARLAYLRAQIYFKQGRVADSQKWVEPLTSADAAESYQGRAVILLMDIHARQETWSEVIRVGVDYLVRRPSGTDNYEIQRRLANAYLLTGRQGAAIALLGNIGRLDDPARDLALDLLRIVAMVQHGDLPGARAVFQAIQPRCPATADNDWWLTLTQLAVAEKSAGNNEEALRLFPLVLQVATTTEQKIQALLQLADVQLALQRVTLARDTLEGIRKTYPDCPELPTVTMRLAQLQHDMGNYLTAAELFAELVNNAKATPEMRYQAWIGRARSLVLAGQLDLAIDAYLAGEQFGSNEEEQSQSLFWAAVTANDAKRFEQAEGLYRKVAERYGKSALGPDARLRQAAVLFGLARYVEAAKAYELFAEEHPAHEQFETALLQRGIALRMGARTPQDALAAATILADFARTCKNETTAVAAYLEAFQSARAASAYDQAVSYLTAIINGYPGTDSVALALYHRVLTRFHQKRNEEALRDAASFFESFPLLPQAAELYILVGDYHANQQNGELAKDFYLRLVNNHDSSPLVPLALYEAAYCAYHLQQFDSAMALLDQLLERFKKTDEAVLVAADVRQALAKAELLKGDILSEQERYAEARACFVRARNWGEDSDLGLQALGRQGEMCLALASENPTMLDEASQCFQAILAVPQAAMVMREMASYRLAKSLERQQKNDEALDLYLRLYFAFTADQANGRQRNWVYFVRSVYDAARILEMRGGVDDMRQAARLYEGLARAGLPASAEAKQRAEGIRASYGLDR
ncbi:tetratricopeptide repeat protein [Oligosphaera ethanolica]|uniref:Tetratricopeptide (TPR) repeat protein n=1 Tax=Oligosphaera ethanolica TaxID=760260 RepID=A0AAE3VDQ4_9BACT|nr:tetratricopeptide repeat protein [Oligosphaera ethanolica]MDQ0288321.1 tetratricopeptide (TPR) repeat protein [Oligosphaera ethanolica]